MFLAEDSFYYTITGEEQPVLEPHGMTIAYIATVVYLIGVFGGQALMKNRQEFKLKWVLRIWNLFLALFSFGVVWFSMIPIWTSVFQRGVYWALSMSGSYTEYPWKGPPLFWMWLFALSKIFEMGDTLWLVLRKRPVPFIHYYHHTSVLLYTWYAAICLAPIGWLFGTINALVHTIMYTYYFLSSCGYKPAWGRHVTRIQLIQMVIGITIAGAWDYYYLAGYEMPLKYPLHTNLVWSGVVMYGSYFVLFLHLYINRFGSTPPPTTKNVDKKPKEQ